MRLNSNWLAVSLSRRCSRGLVVAKWMSAPVSGAANKQAHPTSSSGHKAACRNSSVCCLIQPPPPSTPLLNPPAPSNTGMSGSGGGWRRKWAFASKWNVFPRSVRAFHLFGNDLVMRRPRHDRKSFYLLVPLILRWNLLVNTSSSCLFFFVLCRKCSFTTPHLTPHHPFSVEYWMPVSVKRLSLPFF